MRRSTRSAFNFISNSFPARPKNALRLRKAKISAKLRTLMIVWILVDQRLGYKETTQSIATKSFKRTRSTKSQPPAMPKSKAGKMSKNVSNRQSTTFKRSKCPLLRSTISHTSIILLAVNDDDFTVSPYL